FDGGVLEVSLDGGSTLQDILAVGGSFAIGGYNRTISTDRGSPIAGRPAWSGNSEGFITTTVNLPFLPSVVLRWRMASDTSGSNEGWRVDTVNLFGCHGPPCTPTPTAPPSATPTPTPTATPTTTPSATPTATSTATATTTPTATPTATATATSTPSATPSATPTATARPTPTPRPHATPRVRPTAPPRPIPPHG